MSTMPLLRFGQIESFWERVSASRNGCLVWTGPRTSSGYGTHSFYGPDLDQHTMGVHRAAWMLTRGSIPDQMEIDHLCQNRSCVNPSHMELVTHAENVRRGVVLRRRTRM